VARAANCSKESLYKWFGDREGLLSAVIEFQANKVRTVVPTDPRPDEATFRRHLQIFAIDLIDVLSSDVSLALNRLAIGQASRHGSGLGQLVLDRGRRTIETRAVALLELGHKAGHIAVDDPTEAYATLYGLVVRDSHIRMLLGAPVPARAAREAAARTAVDQFFRLHGAAGKETARP
jgi:AcrR family transcriptional regulator